MIFLVERVSNQGVYQPPKPVDEAALLPSTAGLDPDDYQWTVDIDSLDALMAFVGRHGTIVIGPPLKERPDETMTTIEIYDDYRE